MDYDKFMDLFGDYPIAIIVLLFMGIILKMVMKHMEKMLDTNHKFIEGILKILKKE